MKKLKKPGKKVIGIVAAVFVVAVGGIIALVLHMNREVAPWDTVSWSTTREDIRSRFGEPDYSTGGRGNIHYDQYYNYEFLGASGMISYHYIEDKDSSTITSVGWHYYAPDGKEAKDELVKRLKNYLTDRFGAPHKYEHLDDFYHEDFWYDSDGNEITLLEYFYDPDPYAEVELSYYFYNND